MPPPLVVLQRHPVKSPIDFADQLKMNTDVMVCPFDDTSALSFYLPAVESGRYTNINIYRPAHLPNGGTLYQPDGAAALSSDGTDARSVTDSYLNKFTRRLTSAVRLLSVAAIAIVQAKNNVQPLVSPEPSNRGVGKGGSLPSISAVVTIKMCASVARKPCLHQLRVPPKVP